MKRLAKKLIIGTPLEPVLRKLLHKPKIPFVDSGSYWESRYQTRGNSGSGSYGRLAEFKAEVLNDFVEREGVETLIEFGCGDGNQLKTAHYPKYIGFDVSHNSVRLCADEFSNDESKEFLHTSEFDGQSADLSLSLDVIYHLVEDDVFEAYMTDLFVAAERFVVIYSSNHEDVDVNRASHVRHRRFSDWVEQHATNFECVRKIENKYPYDEENPDDTSYADFYIYKKMP